ncbi:alpha/beta fold hydrolase [Streptomyces sp. NPDC094448]|uniref:alpha/beta fold hydrolase n=1 Tax=Streptomyces sp. NPDC094448 TaxID=3366063 RepID=UPI003823DA6B
MDRSISYPADGDSPTPGPGPAGHATDPALRRTRQPARDPRDAKSVAEVLIRAAREQPDQELRYYDPGGTGGFTVRTHAELLRSACGALAALRTMEPVPGSAVLLLPDSAEDFVRWFWACVLGGFVPATAPPPHGGGPYPAEQFTGIRRLLDEPLVVAGAAAAPELAALPGVRVVACEETAGSAGPQTPYRANRADTAALVLTSGSTGTPKAVRLTHGNLLASLHGKNGVHRLTADDTSLNWVSFDHVAALLECHLLPLSAGAAQLHVPPAAILGDPPHFLRLISEHRVTMAFAPNFLLGRLTRAAPSIKDGSLDLSRLRHIVSGGESVVCDTGRAFLNAYARHGLRATALWPAFGMTETCAGSVYSRDFPLHDGAQEFANLGRPVDGLRLRIAGPDGGLLPDGAIGEVQLHGPVVTPGYHGDDDATAAAFTADGWFRTGDLGRLDDGRLTLAGRSKDSVIVNGVNHFSQDIETVLERLDGVTPSYVAAFPTRGPGGDTEQLAVAFLPERPGDDDALHRTLTAIRDAVVLHWGFRPAVVLPLTRAELPRTSLGKLRRALLRHRLEEGRYEAVLARTATLSRERLGGWSPPEGAAEEAIAGICRDVFAVDEMGATTNFFDLGGTSLDLLRLRGAVARRFGLPELEIATVLQAPTVRRLALRVTGAGAPAYDGYDPVVALQESGAGTPLFCVHPGVGDVLVFVGLARYFTGERPFYALRARGFGPGEEPFGSFAEMVGCYVDAIRRKQPHGPYAVAGYSYGGAVAFEITKALEAAGEQVAFTGSFNLPPHIKYRMDELDFTETAVHLALFISLIDEEQAVRLPGELRGAPEDEQIERLLATGTEDRLDELDLDRAKFAAWARLAHGLTLLGSTYRPTGKVRSMTVFCAHPLRGTKEEWVARELRRWDEHTRGPNRYADVPGEHYTLMSPRHVAAFQAVLRRELRLALPGHETERP